MRLLQWPRDLFPENMTPVNGPLVMSGGSVSGNRNAAQSRSRPGFRWEFSVNMPVSHGRGAREIRGWIMALQGGANVTDYRVFDQHRIAPREYGNQGAFVGVSVPWTNDQPWTNGKGWRSAHPLVAVSGAIAKNATVIELPNQQWGHALGIGDQLGFLRHRGLYMITEVLGPGMYRVFPRINAFIGAPVHATLHPRIALKLSNPGAASMSESPRRMVGTSVTMEQVTHSELLRLGLI